MPPETVYHDRPLRRRKSRDARVASPMMQTLALAEASDPGIAYGFHMTDEGIPMRTFRVIPTTPVTAG